MTRPRRDPAPSKVGPQVNIAFPPDMITEIDTAARELNISRSEWVRRACRQLLDAPAKGIT